MVPDRASLLFSLLALTSRRMLLMADRPTTSRWAPLTWGERSYQVRPILEGKNRGRHFVRKTPHAGEAECFGARPRFSLRPYANRRPRGHQRFNTGSALLAPP